MPYPREQAVATQVMEGSSMADEKYVCPECGKESGEPGQCPACQAVLVATCPICGNPMVGEHVHTEA